MGDMGRFERSWALAKQSWAVLRGNPGLAVFPIVSTVAALLVTATFFVPLAYTIGFENLENPPAYAYPVLFLYYLVSYFVVIFFNSALVHCANEALNGRPAEFGDGINAAKSHFGAILGWALLSATVGTILNAIAERTGFIGRIVVGLFGAAWNIVTFFTVPMLVLEGVGPIDAVKGSFAVIKKTWGESIIGNVGISYAIGLLALLPLPVLFASFFTGSAIVIGLATAISVLYWLTLATVGSSMTGVYTVAVFAYARTGAVPGGFEASAIQAAFVDKPKSKRPFGL